MKRVIAILAIFFCGCKSTGSVHKDFVITQDTKIGVLAFDVAEHIDPKSGIEVADTFGFGLMKAGFNLMDRSQIENVISEQTFQATDLVGEKNAVKIGNIVGVPYILTGVVTEYKRDERKKVSPKTHGYKEEVFTQSYVSFSAKIVDCQSGAIMWIGSDAQESKKTMPEQVAQRLVRRMVKQLAWHKQQCEKMVARQTPTPSAKKSVQTITVPSGR